MYIYTSICIYLCVYIYAYICTKLRAANLENERFINCLNSLFL